MGIINKKWTARRHWIAPPHFDSYTITMSRNVGTFKGNWVEHNRKALHTIVLNRLFSDTYHGIRIATTLATPDLQGFVGSFAN